MGMFDNIDIGFKCKFCGEPVDLQSKDGSCIMFTYGVGDEFIAYDEFGHPKGPETRIIHAYGDCAHRKERSNDQVGSFSGSNCTCYSVTHYIWYDVFIFVKDGIITDITRSIHKLRSDPYDCISPGIFTVDDFDAFNARRIAKEIAVWGRELNVKYW